MAEIQPIRDFHQTDYGNAERLVARHGTDLHYVTRWKRWLMWDGKRWAADETDAVIRLAKETVRAIYREAAEHPRSESREGLAKWAIKSEGAARIAAMLQLTESEKGIPVTHTDLDSDPWKLTCLNGTIDLRTAKLRPHARDDLITKLAPVEYRPDTPCPRWLEFLTRIMDEREDMIGFLQRALGYSLTGSTREQCLFFLHGSGANGKSTFLDVARALLGDNAQQADFSTFLERKHNDGPRNDVAGFVGARLITSSEAGEGKRMDEELVKVLTGEKTVRARHLYSHAFEFQPTFKLWFSANHRPVIRGADEAIWRRIRLIPFTVQIPEGERDGDLGDALVRNELPGILAWAVEGCQRWLEDGLCPPAGVQVATAEYRQESDVLGAFLDENCRIGAEEFIKAGELYQAYVKWAEREGTFKLSGHAFGRRLTDRGFGTERRGAGSTRTVYRTGLCLLEGTQSRDYSVPKSSFWDE